MKRPGSVCLLLALMASAGAVLAHQTTPPRLATIFAKKKRAPRAKRPDWRAELDLNKARTVGDRIEQRLGDGTTIGFTLDAQLQRDAVAYLRSFEVPYAAAVMIDLERNQVVVMAGHSSANPALGHRELCLTPWAPAASVYKLVTASALLERGVPATATVCYHGGLHGLGAEHIRDNPGRDRSCATLTRAIAKSINPVMAKLALRHLDRDQMLEWSNRFGFNAPIPFGLPVEASRARIPSERLERARVAAGFWHTEISPLHGALIASIVARGGVLEVPRIVGSVRRPDGSRFTPQPESGRRVLNARTARTLTRMMVEVTKLGTARRAFGGRSALPVAVAAKTGSLSRSDPFLHYNWLVGFAPADRPEVAFATLLGNPVRWRIKAAAAARHLLERYLAKRGRRRALSDAAAAPLARAATHPPR